MKTAKKPNAASEPKSRMAAVRVDRLVRKPEEIFSGNNSVDLWRHINGANTVPKLRAALYLMGCHCQELESEVRRLSNV